MAKYKEAPTEGVKWQRCRQVRMENRLDEVQRVVFVEEEATQHGNGPVHVRDIGGCSMSFDAEAEIPLLDPDTGLAVGGSVTHGELYAILYSLYMQAAAARDADPTPRQWGG